MPPTVPFWFKQRQCKAEQVEGGDGLRLTGPNLGEAFIRIHQGDNGLWSASLRGEADGPEVASTDAVLPSAEEAWKAAFELYRCHVIV